MKIICLPAIKNTRFKKSYFFKTGLMYSIFIKFAHCTGSKLGGLKNGHFGTIGK